MKKVIRASSSN